MEFTIPDQIYSNDLSHLLKRARKRLVKKNYLFISRSDQTNLNKGNIQKVSIDLIKSFDNSLTDCYFKNNSHDAMDDFYPNAIFSGKSLKNAFHSEHWAAVLYLLPMTCMNRILRDKVACRRYRAIWACIGMFIMFFYWSGLKLQMISQHRELKKENFDSIFSIDFCVDCFNAFFAILLGIYKIENKCSISRIGTIHSEHLFALIRNKAGNKQTIEALKWAFERIIVAKKYDYFMNETISRRLFETGILEEGTLTLSDEDSKKCKLFALKLAHLCGQAFPRESAAYDLLQDVDYQSLDLNFNDWELDIIESLTKEGTFISGKSTGNWVLTASKYRLTNKAGRNITSRYYTKLNTK